jgi:hypothetical protein
MGVAAQLGFRVHQREARLFFLAVPSGKGERRYPRAAGMRVRRRAALALGQARDAQYRCGGLMGVEREAVGAGAAHKQRRLRAGVGGQGDRLIGLDGGAGVRHPFPAPVAAAQLEAVVAGTDQDVGRVDGLALVFQGVAEAPAVEAAADI